MAVFEPIALIMILDFSGSMAQKIENKLKLDLLKEVAVSSLKAVDPKFATSIYYFGAQEQTKHGCASVPSRMGKSSEQISWLSKQTIGYKGKSPIEKALQSALNQNETPTKNILLVTDGEDTCGGNPCQYLVDYAKQHPEAPIRAVFLSIGDSNYDCKAQAESANSELPSNLDFTGLSTEKNKSETSPSAVSALIAKNDAIPKKAGFGRLLIEGLRGHKSILVRSLKLKDKSQKPINHTNWQGNTLLEVPAGNYSVEVNLENSVARARLSIDPNTEKVLSFFKDFRLPTANANLENILLQGDFVPKEGQNGGGSITLSSARNKKIPMGLWNVKISEPTWLKGLTSHDIDVKPGSEIRLSLKMFEGLQYIRAPKAPAVLQILGAENRITQVLINDTAKQIPIKADQHYRWLTE